jgi:hypothetical protein
MTTIMPTTVTGMTMLGTAIAMTMAMAMELAAACCSALRSR